MSGSEKLSTDPEVIKKEVIAIGKDLADDWCGRTGKLMTCDELVCGLASIILADTIYIRRKLDEHLNSEAKDRR